MFRITDAVVVGMYELGNGQSSICIPQAITPLTQSQVTGAPVPLSAAGTTCIAISAVAASTVSVTAHMRYTHATEVVSIPDEPHNDLVHTTPFCKSKFAYQLEIDELNRNCTKFSQPAFT